MKKVYNDIIISIVKKMEKIIGLVAISQANKVNGLKIDGKISVKGNPQVIIKSLLDSYKAILGNVSLTIAKSGAKEILEKNPGLKVPKELR